MKHFVGIVFLFLQFCSVSAQVTPIWLNKTDREYFLDYSNVEILEDVSDKWTANDLTSSEFNSGFKRLNSQFPNNENPGTTYWLRGKVKSSVREQWILECYNIHANILEVYIPGRQSGSLRYFDKSGSDFEFTQRSLQHINFVFFLPDLPEESTIYIKFKSKNPSRVRFLIHSYPHFSNYAFNEYFFLGVFYGIIFIIGFYNLFLYIRLRDVAYFYYAMYAVFVGLFSMAHDGLGFQYLWPTLPQWNEHAAFFYITLMVVFMLLYTRSFLYTREQIPVVDKIIVGYIVLRCSLFFVDLFLVSLTEYIWIDLSAFLLAYVASILAYRKGVMAALYFVIGFSFLFAGYLIYVLSIYKVLASSIVTVYSINGAVVIEMLLLSQALADRVQQIRENELIKEKLNRQLEITVKERTETLVLQKNIIEEKVKALDTFIYKASHDIQGPLKSLIGVATMGIKDTPENSKVYFRHTLIVAKKLDMIMKDLLRITYVTNATLKVEEIDFNKVINSTLQELESYPDYFAMKFDIQIKMKKKFYSENSLLHSIFHNVIENAITYRNPDVKSELKITVRELYDICEIQFTDNGEGIDPEAKAKAFNMFFRLDEKDETGLGLYIVKLCVDKLGGKVSLESEKGKGSVFTIQLKSMKVDS